MAQENSFEIKDRRSHFNEPSTSNEQPDAVPLSASNTTQKDSVPPPSQETMPVDLSSLILSFATSAMVHLGQAVDPLDGEKKVHLPLARQVIDLIALLQRKTAGNRTDDEEKLIVEVLYAMRMKYMELERKGL